MRKTWNTLNYPNYTIVWEPDYKQFYCAFRIGTLGMRFHWSTKNGFGCSTSPVKLKGWSTLGEDTRW